MAVVVVAMMMMMMMMMMMVVVVVLGRPQNHQIPRTILTGPLFFHIHKDRYFPISVTSPSLLYSNLW